MSFVWNSLIFINYKHIEWKIQYDSTNSMQRDFVNAVQNDCRGIILSLNITSILL